MTPQKQVREMGEQTKAEAILDAIRKTDVGSDIIIHNEDMSVFCILTVKCKEHPEKTEAVKCECGHRKGQHCGSWNIFEIDKEMRDCGKSCTKCRWTLRGCPCNKYRPTPKRKGKRG